MQQLQAMANYTSSIVLPRTLSAQDVLLPNAMEYLEDLRLMKRPFSQSLRIPELLGHSGVYTGGNISDTTSSNYYHK
jgi:hypothetical protein